MVIQIPLTLDSLDYVTSLGWEAKPMHLRNGETEFTHITLLTQAQRFRIASFTENHEQSILEAFMPFVLIKHTFKTRREEVAYLRMVEEAYYAQRT